MTIYGGPQDGGSAGTMSQAQWREVESKLWTDGVIKSARNEFAVTTTTGLGLSVNTGDAILDGFRFFADAATALTCATADPSLDRIDLVVLRLDESGHTSTIAIKTGTPASSPVAPTATKTPGGTYELGLSQARVNAGATSITSLTDVRSYVSPTLQGQSASGFALLSGATFTGNVVAPTLAGTLTDGAGGNGIVAHDEGNSIQLRPSLSNRGVDIDYRDSGGLFHHAISISASGGVDIPQGALTVSGGVKVWTAANDGSGSGLDADTVDGVQAAALANLSGATFTGDVTVPNIVISGSGISGPVNTLLPITRNGVARQITVFTGTTSPSSPPSGSIWVKA